ncbi:hypothetical protein HYU93_03965 [Candidatus Daviesbacteria bacterium]|nr:hypothetical protein [Candidatus Daviesbacteria bacterium]
MVKAIIFDNAGVIMSEAYWMWLGKNIPNLEEKRQFFMDISHQVDRETITPTQFLEHLAKETGKTVGQVKEEILNTSILNEEVYELMKKLNLKRLYLLMTEKVISKEQKK